LQLIISNQDQICSNTPDGIQCVDNDADAVNECILNLSNCHKNANCIDELQGYSCICKEGFYGDGVEDCTPVSECLITEMFNPELCPDNFECIDTNTGVGCDDFNECLQPNIDVCPGATCINHVGGYTCEGICPASEINWVAAKPSTNTKIEFESDNSKLVHFNMINSKTKGNIQIYQLYKVVVLKI